MKVFSFHLLGY